MPHASAYRWGVYPLWLLLSLTIFFRPPAPIDETRYLSVAWEMWLRHDFWVPFLNGQAYSHKPPLLFWLFHLGWALFGVNEWWPKMVGPLCALLNIFLLKALAKRLWPEWPQAPLLAPWLLLATLLWTVFATSMMFDILLSCCVLACMLGGVTAWRTPGTKGWALLGLGIALGILAKGPVVYLHIAPPLLLAGFWADGGLPPHWRRHFGFACLAGAGLALLWALPAALSGGQRYANAIFWSQTADRAIPSGIHARPVWWYVQFTPLFLFPWAFWPGIWRAARGWRWNKADAGERFCVIWLISGWLLFSLLPSKQIHYLLPILPAFALLAARLLAARAAEPPSRFDFAPPFLLALIGAGLMLAPRLPGLDAWHWLQNVRLGWGGLTVGFAAIMTWLLAARRRHAVFWLAAGVTGSVACGIVFFFDYNGLAYDLRPAAQLLREFELQRRDCVYVGNYQGQLHFLGRLTQPLPTIEPAQSAAWAATHPAGCMISMEKQRPELSFFYQPHREYWLAFRNADAAWTLKPL